MNKLIKCMVFTAGAVIAFGASAQDQKPKTLQELLQNVKQGQVTDASEARAREAQFAKDKANQQAALNSAKGQRTAQQNRSVELENAFEANELLISQKQAQLRERLGSLSELFGHVTSTGGDARATFQTSMTGAQVGNERIAKIDHLIELASSGEDLPSIEDLEGLWYELQLEMVESGRVVKFPATVIEPNGDQASKSVVRVGVFNMVTEDGEYLAYQAKGTLAVLPRQPSGKFVSAAADLAAATSGVSPLGIDPTGSSGGSFLAALIAAPTLEERAHQGGVVGYIIIALGIAGLLYALLRLVVLTTMSAKVSSQLKKDKASTDNPLGRVLAVHENNPGMDVETLELKLSEAVLKEIPQIESGLTLLKIIATVAPLLGLLGTVTGMIVTFQAITLFGAGDPKTMANGISQALVTTVLGLCVAIPMVLMHTVVNGRAKKVIQVLEERTTGIIAEHTESALRKS